jgi:AcrR family transcriptional regulator
MSGTSLREPSTTRHAGLSRVDVVDAALAIVEAHGGDALTMRRLAADLGVTTTTIYWHVGNRDELVLALIARLAERQAGSVVVGDTGAERVESAARNIWSNALAHRNVTALASRVGATTLLELPLEVALLAELEAAGLREDVARDALRSILMVVAGFLVGAWRPVVGESDLWAGVRDERISDATLAAMGRAPDVGLLFDRTIRTVVAGLVP